MCQLSVTMLTTPVTYYHRLQTHLILESSDGPTVPGLEFVIEIGTTWIEYLELVECRKYFHRTNTSVPPRISMQMWLYKVK